jgi:hypothetical protein
MLVVLYYDNLIFEFQQSHRLGPYADHLDLLAGRRVAEVLRPPPARLRLADRRHMRLQPGKFESLLFKSDNY